MKQEEVIAQLLLKMDSLRLAICAQQHALDPSQRESVLQWLLTLGNSSIDAQESQAAHLARGWLLPKPNDGGF